MQVREAAERDRLVEAYRASGLSAKTFADQHKISVSSLYAWLSAGKRQQRPVQFVRVTLDQPAINLPLTEQAKPLMVDFGVARVEVSHGFDQRVFAAVVDIFSARQSKEVA
jgi:hypothetical protein